MRAQAAQIEAQTAQITTLLARIAELEARLSAPPKTPANSSTPPSKGQKSNLPDRVKSRRGGRPGVSRALSRISRSYHRGNAERLPTLRLCARLRRPTRHHAYDHIELPAISPTSPASTAIAAFVPAAAGRSQRRRRNGSNLARRSGRDCAR